MYNLENIIDSHQKLGLYDWFTWQNSNYKLLQAYQDW